MNLLHSLHDEFIKRFRLSKTTALNLLDKLQIDGTRDGRGNIDLIEPVELFYINSIITFACIVINAVVSFFLENPNEISKY